MSPVILPGSTARAELANLLLMLQQLHPVQGWVYVGAGNGNLLDQAPFTTVGYLLAIEADEKLHARLSARIQNRPQWLAVHALIGPAEAEGSFYRYHNGKEDGLLGPEELAPLWKGLRLKDIQPTRTRSLENVLSTEGEGRACNWLTLDCMPAELLLQGLGESIAGFDVIQVRVARRTESAFEAKGGDHTCVDQWLQQKGFKALLMQEETNAGLASVIYVRDWKNRLLEARAAWVQKSEADRQHFAIERADLQTELQKNERTLQDLKFTDLQLEEARKIIDRLSSQVEQQDMLKSLSRVIVQQKIEVTKNIDKQVEEIGWIGSYLETAIKRELGYAARQIEAFSSVQDYFSTGMLPHVSVYQLEALNPEYCLYLIELIEFNTYDLVIEFGAGASTSALAQSMRSKGKRCQRNTPTQFVSFVHLQEKYQRIQEGLQQAGLDKAVQLTLTPLENWKAADGSTYPYYACQSVLTEIASKQELPGLRVLVLVNGLEQEVDIFARYPAGPLIMQNFAGATLELVVGNAAPEDEARLLQHWQKEVKTAGFGAMTVRH